MRYKDVVGNLKVGIPLGRSWCADLVEKLMVETYFWERSTKSRRQQLERPIKPSSDKHAGASTVEQGVRCRGAILARGLLVAPSGEIVINITPPGSISVAALAHPRSFRVKRRDRSYGLGLGFIHAAESKPPANIPTRTSLPTPSIKIKATTVRTEARRRIWPSKRRKEGR